MSNDWSPETRKLLINWSKQISINEVEHRRVGQQLYYAYIFIGIFIIIAQSGVLTGLFSAIASGNPSMLTIIILAVIQTVITIVQGVTQFFNTGGGSEQHYRAALDYKSLGEFIDATLSLPPEKRGSAESFLISVRREFKDLRKTTPPLPYNKVIHQLDMTVYNDPRAALQPNETVASNEEFGSIPECSSDEHCSFRAGVQEQRVKTLATEDRGPLEHLHYQWERMQLDEEQP